MSLGDLLEMGLTAAALMAANLPAAPKKKKAVSKPKPPTGLKVFTVGHSFHVWAAEILAGLAKEAGIKGHEIAGISSIGGSRVIQHWDVPDDKNALKEALTAGKVDVLTLSPIWLPDDGIEKLATLALTHNPNVRITVQKFWLPNDEYMPVYPLQTGKKVDHDATTMRRLRKDYAKYASDMQDMARNLNEKLGKPVMYLVPSGEACILLREKILAGQAPSLTRQSELFTDSWGHPTAVLKTLASYCHFAAIYRQSPVGLPIPPILTSEKQWNDADLNRLLQKLAWDAVCHEAMSRVGRSR